MATVVWSRRYSVLMCGVLSLSRCMARSVERLRMSFTAALSRISCTGLLVMIT